MKILIVSTSFSKFPGDNISPFIWKLSKNLQDKGWDVTVLAPHYKGLPERENWEGVEIRRFRYFLENFENFGYDAGGIIPNIKRKPLRLFKLPLYISAMHRDTLQIINEKEIDIVNFHWLFPSSLWLPNLIKQCKVKAVVTGHGTDIHLALKWPFSFFVKKAVEYISAITLNSQYMGRILGEVARPLRTEILPMAVDTSTYHPGAKKPSDSKKIIYVGRLMKQKGIYMLLDAFGEILKGHPDAALEFVGPGPEFEALKEKIAERKLEKSVRVSGIVEHVKLPEIYVGARVLILPSLIGEGMGLTPIEAGACGVPSITFGFGGTEEIIVNDQTGMIVKPTVQDLTSAIGLMLNNGNEADRMGREALAHVRQNYSWDVISGKFDKLFREIANAGQVRPEKYRNYGNHIMSLVIFFTVVTYVLKLFSDRIGKITEFFR